MEHDGAVSGRGIIPPKYRTLLLILFVVAIAVLPSSAIVSYKNPNFTPIFDVVGAQGADEVHYNQTYTYDSTGTTPAWLWVIALVASFVFFLLSLKARVSSAEVEIDAIISVLPWVTSIYTAITAFSVEVVEGSGVAGIIESEAASGAINTHEWVYMANHQVYSFDAIGWLMGVFTFVCILNTIRILSLHSRLRMREENNRLNE